MVIAIVLLLIVVGSVLFQWFTPWFSTPLASNWQSMDDMLVITLVVTGVFFVGINLFIVLTLWHYRHRAGSRAAYQPENRPLERWLIGLTALGIVALLAPGLAVYARYVQAPGDAMVLEVVGWGAAMSALSAPPIRWGSIPPTRPGRMTSWCWATRSVCRRAGRSGG